MRIVILVAALFCSMGTILGVGAESHPLGTVHRGAMVRVKTGARGNNPDRVVLRPRGVLDRAEASQMPQTGPNRNAEAGVAQSRATDHHARARSNQSSNNPGVVRRRRRALWRSH